LLSCSQDKCCEKLELEDTSIVNIEEYMIVKTVLINYSSLDDGQISQSSIISGENNSKFIYGMIQ
jgi:hypothetical protein